MNRLTEQDLKEGKELIEKYETLSENEKKQVEIYIGALYDRRELEMAAG